MIPNKDLITINDNENKIKQFLTDLIIEPRIKALRWSQITNQTPNLKVGYPAQHLASLITGMKGVKTGARGDDLIDGTEIKGCSRLDQLDKCNDCEEKILRTESKCPACNSEDIKRNNDSKWLFTIRSENDLTVLTDHVERILLIISDYPYFDENNFEDIRIQAFEIWTHSNRHENFSILMRNYYEKIYLGHKEKNSAKTPAPKNFWPYSFQFFMCNPIKTFSCIITNANTEPSISIDYLLEPKANRTSIESEPMPVSLLKPKELTYLTTKLNLTKLQVKELSFIDENTRGYLSLRDTDIISVAKNPYIRGS